jgi:4-aminobutyrate aminotransferase-like enzyme
MKGLRKICNKHGIVFIVDEVNTGFGRTGELFASTYHGEDSPPDILVLSKGFASGFPLSAADCHQRGNIKTLSGC